MVVDGFAAGCRRHYIGLSRLMSYERRLPGVFAVV